MTTRKPLQPRCPHCASGRLKLVSERIDEYYRLFYCAGCGAAHGVVPDLVEEKSFFDEVSLAEDDSTPRCPTHHTDLKQVTVPPGYKEAGKTFWVCTKKGCSYKEEAPNEEMESPPKKSDRTSPDAARSPAGATAKGGDGRRRRSNPRRDRQGKGLSIFEAKRAILDLANKATTQKITPDRIGAMVHGAGGLYSEIMMAPLCSEHKIPMEQITVPELYLEAGQKMWVCPHYGACEYWEWVKKKPGE